MKQLQWAAIAAISIMIGMTISCGRNVFDEQKYKDIVDSISPVDSVDATHTWTLTKLKTTTVQIPDSDDMQRVMILTSNPRETGDAAVVGEAWGSAGEKVLMTFSYPSTMTKLYAALMDDDGYYCIEE